MKVRHFVLFILTISWFTGKAQEEWEADGEISDAEIVIEKDKKLELQEFSRYFNKVRTEKITSSTKEVTYKTMNLNYTPLVKSNKVRIQRLATEPLQKLYNGQVTLGYGNFGSPLVDLLYANKRSEKYSFGAHFNHLSYRTGPVDGENSASGETSMSAFAKGFGKSVTFSGSAGYSNRFNHFYGYSPELNPDQDSLKQSFNTYYFTGGLNGTNLKSKFNYKLGGTVSGTTNDFNAEETSANIISENSLQINDEISGVLNASFQLSNYDDDQLSLQRNLLKVQPRVNFQWSGFLIRAGFNLLFSADSTDADAETAFYPDIEVAFPITEVMDLYGGLKGDRTFVSYQNLTEKNPWIAPNVDIRNTVTKFEIYGGLRTKLSDKVSADVGFSTGSYDDIYFFANSEPDSSQFSIIYDSGSTTVFRLSAGLEYALAEKASLSTRFQFNGYDTDRIQEAWHKPQFELDIDGKYNLFNKFIFSPGVSVLGGIEGINLQSGNTAELETYTNVHLKTDYIISERAGIYINLDNILGSDNQRFMNYLSRGFMISAGFRYAF